MEIEKYRKEIEDAVSRHRVTLIEASTGLGKSTRIPMMLHEMYPQKSIIVTQPRRIAATSLANYMAKISNTKIGELYGYSVRFDSKITDTTKITFCTDGVMLVNGFDSYDIIIIDEAHCRSLASDINLALIRDCLTKTNVKVLIMSATMKSDVFLEYFAPFSPKLIQIVAKNFPVQLYYAPYDYTSEQMTEQVITQVNYILNNYSPGDILIFTSGYFEIEKIDEKLKVAYPIIKLHSSTSSEVPATLFKSTEGFRIIISTNIAESSITIPNVKYVIDTMLVKRFELKDGSQLLVERTITKFEATQRSGRAGRIGPGICWRMITEDTYSMLDDCPTPEILSANYSDILLVLASKNIRPKDLKFITPFDARSVESVSMSLYLMGLINQDFTLTPLGTKVVEIPLETELALSLVKAKSLNCYDDMAKVSAMISSWPLRKTKSLSSTNAENDLVMALRIFNSEYRRSDTKTEKYVSEHVNPSLFHYTTQIYNQLTKNMKKEGGSSDISNLVYAFFSGHFLHLAQKVSVDSFTDVRTAQKLTLNKKLTSLNGSCNFVCYCFLIKKDRQMILNSGISPEMIRTIAGHVYSTEVVGDRTFVKAKEKNVEILLKTPLEIENTSEIITVKVLPAKKRRNR